MFVLTNNVSEDSDCGSTNRRAPRFFSTTQLGDIRRNSNKRSSEFISVTDC